MKREEREYTRIRFGAFTLVELLISISILSIISAVSYTTFITVRRAVEVNRRNEELLREVRGFLDKLDAEVSSALYVRRDEGTLFFSRRFEIEGRDVNNLIFTTIKPQTYLELGKRGEIVRVEYEITPNEENDEYLVLTKKLYYYTLPPRDFDEPFSFTVSDSFSAFMLRFKSGGKWFDSWDTKKMNNLPDGVELTISLGNGKRYREYFNVFISEM